MSAKFTVLLVVLFVVFCHGERKVVVDSSSLRIISGTPTPLGKYIAMASLQRSNSHWCGCTVVTTTIIVTAAHCVSNLIPFDFSVLVGTIDVTSGGQRYAITSISQHPNYDGSQVFNDLAVGKTASSIVLGPNVGVANLPARNLNFEPGSTGQVMGWGETGKVGGTKVLLEVSLTLITEEQCNANLTKYGYRQSPTKQALCVVPPGGGTGQGNCFGDSGGPLFIRGVFAGVSSFHILQCGTMSGFTRIANYIDWIMCMAE